MNARALPLPWRGVHVPHAVIEVNQQCNLDCDGCYKDKFASSKSLDEVRAEIALAAERRRLTVLTLAGGEPTLHPRLPEIIAEVARRGIRPLLLTNGTLLTPERLRTYREAGLARVALHVDRRQRGRPDAPAATGEAALNPLRRALAERCASAGLDVTHVLTVYEDTLSELPQVIAECLASPAVTALLATAYSARVDRRRGGARLAPIANRELRRTVEESEGARPIWRIGSDRDPGAERWLFYEVAVTVDPAGTVRKLWWDPRDRVPLWLIPRLDRLVRGRYHFDPPMTARDRARILGLYALLSGSAGTLVRTRRFLAEARRNGNLKTCAIVFQEPPSATADGSIDPCRDCPDATVRDGALVPICMADELRPLRASERLGRAHGDAGFERTTGTASSPDERQ